MNQATIYVYNKMLDLIYDKYEYLNNKENIDLFWENILNKDIEFKKEVKKFFNINSNDINIYVKKIIEFYNYFSNLSFDEKEQQNEKIQKFFYDIILKKIDSNEELLNSFLNENEKIKLVQKFLQHYGYIINYAKSGGFIFPDGSILDIGPGEDHSIIDFDYVCKTGIITYRLVEEDLYLKYVKNKITYKQKKVVEEIIKYKDIDEIHYEVYNENAKLLKQRTMFIENYKIGILFSESVNYKRKYVQKNLL